LYIITVPSAKHTKKSLIDDDEPNEFLDDLDEENLAADETSKTIKIETTQLEKDIADYTMDALY
jgi:hypothetical protein